MSVEKPVDESDTRHKLQDTRGQTPTNHCAMRVIILCVAAGLVQLVMCFTRLHVCARPRGVHILLSLLCFACAAINVRNLRKYQIVKPVQPKKLEWY